WQALPAAGEAHRLRRVAGRLPRPRHGQTQAHGERPGTADLAARMAGCWPIGVAGMSEQRFRVRMADWERECEPMRAIRTPVFIVEQQVPQDIEWDDKDPLCVHALAIDADGAPIGTGRLAPDGKIGRMAVLPDWRGRGVGAAILEFLVHSAR